ncbi:MAG: DUF3084 domain-containing protein [Sporomusaceae bacterium]|nr:DUF3084 domain-containing protein [Sporomusaceae bacterium]
MFGIALIAILAITGGIIAYIGDKLGTKVGKKKLTIFGLRPKHTSILVTIITGILITVSTIGILTLVSRDVRTALFGMEALKTELATLSHEVTAQNSELDASRSALEAKTAEFTLLNLKVQDAAAKLAAIADELSVAIAQRDYAAQQLQQTQKDYTRAKGDLTSAQQAITTLQKTKSELDARVNTLAEAKATLETDVIRLNELTANLKQGIQVVRGGSIIYRAGEILTTAVLPAGTSQDDTVKALSNIVYKANQSIIDKLEIEDKNLEVLWVSQSDFDKVATEVGAAQQDVIVRIAAGGNTVYGEPVVGHLSVFPNHHVYKQGQTIFMTIIDVGQDTIQAETAVMRFLSQVNAAAIKEGILPDPIQGTVGVISGTEFYEAVNAAKRYKGKITLTATAQDDTYTAGPLKIAIHIQGTP